MDWSYVSAFYDGEGHSQIRKTSPRGISVLLAWDNTDRAALQAIRQFIGCGNIYPLNPQPRLPSHQICYRLAVTDHENCLRIARAMREHSLVKREKLQNFVEFIEERKWFYKLAGVGKEELHRLYWEEGKSIHAIAVGYGVTDHAVEQRMASLGIARRSLREALALRLRRRLGL